MAAKNIVSKTEDGVLRQVRGEELNPFLMLRNEMDKVFDAFFHGFPVEQFASSAGSFQPKVNVVDSEKDVSISVELPGMDEKDIDISLAKDAITIRGEKKEEKEEKGKNYYRMERSYGSFSRSIPIPVEINQDKVEATYKQGVLSITLPKTEKAVKETKKIGIKTK